MGGLRRLLGFLPTTEDHTDQWDRPARGAVLLKTLGFDPVALQQDLARFEGETWESRVYGSDWQLLNVLTRGKDGEVRHPTLADCPTLLAIIDTFPSRPIDMIYARINPGASVHEHRDFSGNAPMGVARFHVPVITHEEVVFHVSGDQVRMAPGSVWNLDTSYPHQLANHSPIARVHIIFDLDLNDAIASMLPPRDWLDRAHVAYFYGLCAKRAAQLAVSDPAEAKTRIRNFARLRFKGESVMSPGGDDT